MRVAAAPAARGRALASARTPGRTEVVSLAGCTDLALISHWGLGGGAADDLMGRYAQQVPGSPTGETPLNGRALRA